MIQPNSVLNAPDDLDIETYGNSPDTPISAQNGPKPSRLRKLVLTVSVEYLMDSNETPALKDNLEAIAEEILSNDVRLIAGTNATIDIKASGVREEKV